MKKSELWLFSFWAVIISLIPVCAYFVIIKGDVFWAMVFVSILAVSHIILIVLLNGILFQFDKLLKKYKDIKKSLSIYSDND